MINPATGSRTRLWMLLIIGVPVAPMLLVSFIILYEFRQAYHEKVTAHLEELVGKRRRASGLGGDLHPHTRREDVRTTTPPQTCRTFGPAATHTGAVRRQFDPLIENRSLTHFDQGAPHDPTPGPVELGVAGIIAGDVLQQTSRRVEAETSARVDITESHHPLRSECTRLRRRFE